MPTVSYRVTITTPDVFQTDTTEEEIADLILDHMLDPHDSRDGFAVEISESRLLRVEGRQGPTGAWHYVEIGKNGEVTSTSENYSSKSTCEEQGTIKAHELGVPFVWEPPGVPVIPS